MRTTDAAMRSSATSGSVERGLSASRPPRNTRRRRRHMRRPNTCACPAAASVMAASLAAVYSASVARTSSGVGAFGPNPGAATMAGSAAADLPTA
eukprot:2980308-Prymnesium_polylepis.2